MTLDYNIPSEAALTPSAFITTPTSEAAGNGRTQDKNRAGL